MKPDGRGVTVVGRRRAGDLRLPGRHGAQHPGLPGPFQPPARIVTLEQNYRSTQPILDAANAVIGLAPRAATARSCSRPARSQQQPRPGHGPRRAGPGRPCGPARPGQPRGGPAAARPGGAVPGRPPQRSTRARAGRRTSRSSSIGGLRFLEAAHIKDVLAILRWAENPRDRVAAFRVLQLLPGIGPAPRARRWRHSRPTAAELAGLGELRAAARGCRALARLIQLLMTLARAPLAGAARAGAAVL